MGAQLWPRGELGDEGYSSFHDVDTPAEVDAAFRSQRRIAVTYFVVFAVVVAAVSGVTVASEWATTDRILGGFRPSFLMTAVGLYLLFVAIGVASAGLANGVDDRMLGADSLPSPGRSSAPITARPGSAHPDPLAAVER